MKNGYIKSQYKRLSMYLLLLCSLLFSTTTIAQLRVTANGSAQQLVETMVGKGYIISNVRSTCPAGAMGTFIGTTSNIGIPNGVLLTTGQVSIAPGPDNSKSAGADNGAAGDSQLDSLYKTVTNDACAIEFDFIPACETFEIKYAFASEEYPESVGKEFNDVFAFFISGPGINGKQNIATVPGTTNYVSINTINAGKNANYYVPNVGGQTIQYDGFTKPMVASAKVIPCNTYHLKVVIADNEDRIFDSGVFIEGGSIDCAPVVYNEMASNIDPVRNCRNGSYTFCRTGDMTNPFVVKYQIGGTAINGIDYQMIPDSVIIPAGKKCATIDIIPVVFGTAQPTKKIDITYKFGFCPQIQTLSLILTDPVPLDAGPDAVICSGDSTEIGTDPFNGVNYTWTPSTGLTNPNSSKTNLTLVNNTASDIKLKYTLKSYSAFSNCTLYDTVVVTVRQHPTASFAPPASVCLGVDASFKDSSIASIGARIKNWYWEFGNGLFDTSKTPSIKYPVAGTYPVKLTVKDDGGCTDDTTLQISVWDLPKVDFSYLNACLDDSVRFTNLSTIMGPSTISSYVWNFGDNSPFSTFPSPKHLYPKASSIFSVQLIAVSDKNCIAVTTKQISLNAKPTATFTVAPACIFNSMKFNNDSDASISQWVFDDGTISSIRNPHHTFNTVGNHLVKLVVKNNFGCTDSITKQVLVNDQPKFDFVTKNTTGCPTFCTEFHGIPLAGSDTIVSWSWKFNAAENQSGKDVVKCYSEKGSYSQTLIATSNKGCSDTLIKASIITVFPVPKAAFIITPEEVTIYDPKVEVVDVSTEGVEKRFWNLGDGTNLLDVNKFTHTYPQLATYYTISLKVVNQFGCVDSTKGKVFVKSDATVYIPNAFTPNEDNKNEKFYVYASGSLKTAKFKMYIFDRWGNRLFTSNSLSDGWDGFYKGELCEGAVYVYSVIFSSEEDGTVLEKFRGKVTLVK